MMATAGQAETPKICDKSQLVNGIGEQDNSHLNNNTHHNAMKDSRYYENHRMTSDKAGDNPPPLEGQGQQQQHYAPPPPPQHQQQYQQYPPYRTGYEQPGQPPIHNSSNEHYQQQHYPPPMRFPGKPMPGGPTGSQQQPPPGHQYPPQQMRGSYAPGSMTGQSISQQPSGPTPTLNQLLQSSGGANAGASGPTPPGGHRYPPPPPTGYEHPNYSKAEYPPGPTGWPPPPASNRPNSYGHPPPFQQPQPIFRQTAPPGGSRSGPPHPGQPYYQHHTGASGGYPPPPQSPHYPPPPHAAQPRYPSPGPGIRPPENQPPSHYPGQLPPGMPPESSGLGPAGGPPNSNSNSEGGHPPKSTPPPSPSLAQQQGMNHAQNPPSPQQSPRSTPHPQPPPNSSNNCPPPNSPSHRPSGSSPSNSYPPPDVGEVTGCNSNDSVGATNASGVRPSPSPTGSASSRSMSPAVGNQNIPMPPRPSSSQSDGSNAPRMSQSPMPGGQGGSYPGQPMAPPHHIYQSVGKLGHPAGGMIPPGPGGHQQPPPQSHYQQPSQQHWQHQQGQPGQQQPGYGVRPPQHGGMMSPYPPPPTQQPMPANSYPPPPRHPIPNHVGGPPPQNQYSPYPPQYGGPPSQPQQPWPGQNTAAPPGTPPNPNSRSHSLYLKQHLQTKLGFSPPPGHGQGGYPMGPPQSSNLPSSSPSQTPPPHHHPSQQGPPDSQDNLNSNSGSIPPNIVSVGPDGANVDEVSQQSTLSNASGASGGDDGPAMPKLRPEGSRSHQNYPSHPATPQNNAAPSPGAASMSSVHEDTYGEMNSPGWPRTPASPGLNSHPQPPSEHYRGKTKKADSLNKLYDMDDNPERRMFLDKLIHYMEDLSNPITSCPTISKNPLDLFKLYFLVKERGGFIEVTKNKTWKDIAGSLGIGASSSAAYTLRKHYTKHLLPFECKFDRGGIDPQPLINQVETTTKKKGKGPVPVPSPGSSNSQDSFPGPNNNTNSSMDGFNSSSSAYPSPYGQPPTSDYGQQSGAGSGPGSGTPVGPSMSRPGGQVPPSPNSQQGPQQHPGDKAQISVSNPFDDMHPANQYSPHYQQSHNQQQGRLNYYAPYSTQPSGYQGPPGNYPPYPGAQGDQYSGRPPMEGYSQSPYPGYPPSGRPPYPYPDGQNSSPSAASGYPSPQQSPGAQPLPSQQHPSVPPASQNSNSGPEDRYSMAPPTSNLPTPPNNYPPQGRGPYPSGGSQGPPGPAGAHPPPNGYPGQDYYHSQAQTEQGYPGMGGQSPGSGQGPTVPGGKHMPPPHQNQMRYPPGKESPAATPFPSYPSQSQGTPPQQRVPSYDGQSGRVGYMYPPSSQGSSGTSRDPGSGTPNSRSTPSPSPSVTPAPHSSTSSTLPPQKQWNPPEGWPGGSGSHFPGPQRPYPGSPQGGPGAGASTSQPTTPAPSQSPGAPVSTPPQQAPSPQPWGSSGGPGSSRGPPVSNAQGPSWPQSDQRFGPNSGSIMSPPPAGNSTAQGPSWTPPSSGSRASGRPSFPGGKPGEMFKGYGPSPSVQPPPGIPSASSKGPMGPQPSQPPPQGFTPQQGPIPAPQAASATKKEIVFPSDSVEAVTPVLNRRKKLHKNDVAPVEAWRIMMCLKSGLLAETTWALDVLNVLLYDDHSVSYFSLSCLPGLLDILLEHLRRALILVFGEGIGIDLVGDKSDELAKLHDKSIKWYEKEKKEVEDEPDIGTPLKNFPRESHHRVVVLQGSTNYTMVSRVKGRRVGIISKDDEPFVVGGPREWDADEKFRSDPDVEEQKGTMDVTKHIVTYFSSDLRTVPIVRDLSTEAKEVDEEIKMEVAENPKENEEDEVDLTMYRCETKQPITNDIVQNSNPETPNAKKPIVETCTDSLENGVKVPTERKNCQVLQNVLQTAASKISSTAQKKAKRLDDVLGRIRKDQSEDDNAMSETPLLKQENESELGCLVESDPNPVLENGCSSDNAVMGVSDNSNLSAANSENTCDSKLCKTVVVGDLQVRDPGCTLKRRRVEDYEDECYTRDESSLFLVTESQDALARRCLSICNIVRNLTFVPGNDIEFGKCVPFLSLIGKLMLLHHDHPLKEKSGSKRMKMENEDETETDETILEESGVDVETEDGLTLGSAAASVDIDSDSCTSLNNEEDWWWDYVHHLREHVLVMVANISGQMDLSQYTEEVSRPILDGLLHWAVCPAAYGQDPFPTLSPGAYLSPQRLAIEALCKLSVIQGNVDLLLATPPYSRIEKLCQLLCRSLCRSEEQVMREFSLNLLFYLSAADSGVARTIALQNPCISLLISFIEQAEHNAMNIANTHGFSVLRENPEAMGTSLDMLRRAASTLLNLARHPDNRALFVQHEPRLLQLVMSQILEQKVAAMVAQVLFQCSTPDGPNAQKYFYSSNTESFYTPSFSRSRSSQQPNIG